MPATVLGLFEDQPTAANVVQDLSDRGFDTDLMSVVSGGYQGDRIALDPLAKQKHAVVEGAGIGAAIGAAGGIIASLASLAIPGVGVVLAAGPIISALVGATSGAIAGGFVGGLVDLGLSEHHAHAVVEGIRRGGTLVAVACDDDRADEAADVMRKHDPVDLQERTQQWRSEGWKSPPSAASASDNAHPMTRVLVVRRVIVIPGHQPSDITGMRSSGLGA
jgi:hypothetical protein